MICPATSGRFVTASPPDRISDESPQVSGEVLKRFLSIFSDRIFDSNVDRGMLNLAAAPLGPNIRPRLSFRAASIISFSCARSLYILSVDWDIKKGELVFSGIACSPFRSRR
jgi:hypothetical protein